MTTLAAPTTTGQGRRSGPCGKSALSSLPGAHLASDQLSLVKHANDIVEVINDYVPLQRQGRGFKGLCPFHDDHNPSMQVDPERQSFICWACQTKGDVFDFIQKYQKVDFREALVFLARRANIELKAGDLAAARGRTKLYDLLEWAAERFHRCLQMADGEAARRYLLEERRLTWETAEKYKLGYAPNQWGWLRDQARRAGWSWEQLQEVGLCLPGKTNNSPYDAFRDRVIFPIRDVRGQTIAFGGRILPGSSQADRSPKYYNSAESPLFTKSKHLYGLDQARLAAEKAGYLAVVEGYTDVLMAHQMGVLPVVATLGTALNSQHIDLLRKYARRVVLVYDADAGGQSGVDRALTLFVSHEIDLAIATLPEGMDPCDFLLAHGADAFRAALSGAQEALEFKIGQVCAPEREQTIEGRRQAVEAVLKVLALAPENPGQTQSVKRDLIVTRLMQRFGIPEQTIRSRLRELQREQTARKTSTLEKKMAGPAQPPVQKPEPAERDLVQVLLVEPALIGVAKARLPLEEIEHPSIRRVVQELYALHEAGQPVQLEQVRARLEDKPKLADSLGRHHAEGLERSQHSQPAVWLDQLLVSLAQRRFKPHMQQLKDALDKIGGGPPPRELLSQYQQRQGVPTTPPVVGREP